MKLVRPEAHSADRSRWFNERKAQSVICSVLIEVELMRATRRSVPERIARASVLRGIGVVTVSPSVIARAAGHDDRDLRSLDAIHLATAEHVVSVTHEVMEALLPTLSACLLQPATWGCRSLLPACSEGVRPASALRSPIDVAAQADVLDLDEVLALPDGVHSHDDLVEQYHGLGGGSELDQGLAATEAAEAIRSGSSKRSPISVARLKVAYPVAGSPSAKSFSPIGTSMYLGPRKAMKGLPATGQRVRHGG